MGGTFFGVGPLEMLLIAVLALIFIGPQRLPGVIQQVMRVVRELRAYASDAQETLQRELEPLREEFEEMTRDINAVAQDISTQASEIASQTQQVMNETTTMVSTSPSLDYAPAAPVVEEAPRPDEFPALPQATAVAVNGIAHDDERPSFGDYRPS